MLTELPQRVNDSQSLRGLSCDPKHPAIHLFESAGCTHAFIPNGSQVYGLGRALADELRNTLVHEGIEPILERLQLSGAPSISDEPLISPPLKALSLAIAQKCNLGCTYCYAQEGSFGGAPKEMPLEVALKSVDLLFRDATSGERVNLAFLGGEPLTNRRGVRAAAEYAARLAREKNVRLGLSI